MLRFWRLACVALAPRRKNGKIRAKCDVWVQMLATERFSRLRGVIQLVMAAIAAACLFAAGPVMADGKRVALIIGNANYASNPSLANPSNDARLIADKVRSIGFEVTTANDVSLATLRQTLIAFGSKADNAEVALIYYAGHGVMVNGENWIVPVDAALLNPREVVNQAMRLSDLTNTVSGAKIKVVLLDACRDNPFRKQWVSSTRSIPLGLGAIGDLDNAIVIFAAAANQAIFDGPQGENSWFAKSLSQRLIEPGVSLLDLASKVADDVKQKSGGIQIPSYVPSLRGEPYYLVQKLVKEPSALDKDEIDWLDAKRTNTRGGYKIYLVKQPTGKYRATAVELLDILPPDRPTSSFALPDAPQFDGNAYPLCRGSLNVASAGSVSDCKDRLNQFKSGVLDRFPEQLVAHIAAIKAMERDQLQSRADISETDKAKFRSDVQQREADAADGGKLMQSYATARNRWDSDLAYLNGIVIGVATKPLPLLPNAPVFALSAFPNCRNSWQSATDQTAQVTAIGACRDAYNQYQTGVVNPFATKISEHNQQMRALLAGVETDPGFSDTDKAGFRDLVKKRETDTASGGMLVPDFDRARQGISADLAYLTENLNRLMPQQMGLPYRAPQLVRRYESDGFPIMPDPPGFSYGPYPDCKDNWKTIADPSAKANATVACKNTYSAYRTEWLNRYREAMNANVTLVNAIYGDEVSRFNLPGAYNRILKFNSDTVQRGKDIMDGGRLMADYEAALAKWKADFSEVEDSYYRATGCKGYPTPAGLAPNTSC